MIVGLGKTRIQPVRIGVQFGLPIREMTNGTPFALSLCLVSRCLHELPKLPHRQLVLPHVKRRRDLDLMDRTFSGQMYSQPFTAILLEPEVDFLTRRSHRELAGRDESQLHADTVGRLDWDAQLL